MNIYILLDFHPGLEYGPLPISKLIFLCVFEIQVEYERSYEYLVCPDHRLQFTGLQRTTEQVDANGTGLCKRGRAAGEGGLRVSILCVSNQERSSFYFRSCPFIYDTYFEHKVLSTNISIQINIFYLHSSNPKWRCAHICLFSKYSHLENISFFMHIGRSQNDQG